jgi:hypothetical protein
LMIFSYSAISHLLGKLIGTLPKTKIDPLRFQGLAGLRTVIVLKIMKLCLGAHFS